MSLFLQRLNLTISFALLKVNRILPPSGVTCLILRVSLFVQSVFTILVAMATVYLNLLSPNSDQQQFSPNDIHHTLSRHKVMVIIINKMII